MDNQFGDVNDMVLSQFDIAVKYYEKRRLQINADRSISPDTKKYFDKLYTKRVAELKEAERSLKDEINAARAAGTFVNSETATLNNLGAPTATSPTQFDAMDSGEGMHNLKFALKVIGGILLPGIGTYYAVKSIIKQVKAFKERNKILARENTDLSEFVNETKRPHDKALVSDRPFTDEEMKNIVETPGEIARLEGLLSSTTLNPMEKKNLTQKLTQLKEFVQKNGYTLSGTTLSSVETSSDKKEKDIVQAVAEETVFSLSGTKLNSFLADFNKLGALKQRLEGLQDPANPDIRIQNALTSIQTKTTTLKGNAQAFIDSESATISGELDAIKLGRSTDKYEKVIEALNTYFNTQISTKIGLSLDDAESAADTIGVRKEKLSDIRAKYLALVDKYKDKKAKDSKTTQIQTLKNEIKAIVEPTPPLSFTDTTPIKDIIKAKTENEEAADKIAQLEALLEGKRDTDLESYKLSQKLQKTMIEKEHTRRLDIEAIGEKDLVDTETELNANLPTSTNSTDFTNYANKIRIFIDMVKDPNSPFAQAYVKKYGKVKYITDLQNAEAKLKVAEQTAAQQESAYSGLFSNFDSLKADVSDTLEELEEKLRKLKELKDEAQKPEMSVSKSVIRDMGDALEEIKLRINALKAIKDRLHKEYETINQEYVTLSTSEIMDLTKLGAKDGVKGRALLLKGRIDRLKKAISSNKTMMDLDALEQMTDDLQKSIGDLAKAKILSS